MKPDRNSLLPIDPSDDRFSRQREFDHSAPVAQSAAKRKRDAVATRAGLLNAARRCFVEKGFDATRVDEIAALAGVNKRMLYVYFGNKEQLYVEVLKVSFEKAIALGQVRDDPGVHPAVRAKSIISEFFHFVAGDPGFVRLVGWENLGERSAKLLADMMAVGLQGLHATIERGKSENVFRKELDEQKLVLSVTTLCIGFFSRRSTLRALWGKDIISDPDSQNELLDHIIDIVLYGILNPEAQIAKDAEIP